MNMGFDANKGKCKRKLKCITWNKFINVIRNILMHKLHFLRIFSKILLKILGLF